ncbi:Tar ligand binding domain-containing protein, partial [Chitinasiproducens palmae]
MKHMTIRSALRWVVGVMVTLALVMAAVAFTGLHASNDSLRTLNEEDKRAESALSDSYASLLRARLQMEGARSAYEGGDFDSGKTRLGKASEMITQSDARWQDYLKVPRDAKETPLANTLIARRNELMEKGMRPLVEALDKMDLTQYRDITGRQIDSLAGAVSDASSAVMGYRKTRADALVANATRNFRIAVGVLGGGVLLALLLGLGAGVALKRLVLTPLEELIARMRRIAGGDLSDPIVKSAGRQNEIGRIRSVLGEMQGNLAGLVGGVRQGVYAMAGASREIAAGNTDLSSRTEQQAASLQETASSM